MATTVATVEATEEYVEQVFEQGDHVLISGKESGFDGKTARVTAKAALTLYGWSWYHVQIDRLGALWVVPAREMTKIVEPKAIPVEDTYELSGEEAASICEMIDAEAAPYLVIDGDRFAVGYGSNGLIRSLKEWADYCEAIGNYDDDRDY